MGAHLLLFLWFLAIYHLAFIGNYQSNCLVGVFPLLRKQAEHLIRRVLDFKCFFYLYPLHGIFSPFFRSGCWLHHTLDIAWADRICFA